MKNIAEIFIRSLILLQREGVKISSKMCKCRTVADWQDLYRFYGGKPIPDVWNQDFFRSYKKDTFYRFDLMPKANWERLQLEMTGNVIRKHRRVKRIHAPSYLMPPYMPVLAEKGRIFAAKYLTTVTIKCVPDDGKWMDEQRDFHPLFPDTPHYPRWQPHDRSGCSCWYADPPGQAQGCRVF